MRRGDRIRLNINRSFGLRRRQSLECSGGYKLHSPTVLIVLHVLGELSPDRWCKFVFLNELDGHIGVVGLFSDEMEPEL